MAHIIFNKTLLCSFLGGMISVSSLAQNMSTPSKNASVSSTNAEEIQAKVYTLEQCVNEAVSNNLKLRNDVLQVNLRHNEAKTTKIQVEMPSRRFATYWHRSFLLFYLPILDVTLLSIEVDADFYDRLTTKDESLAIVF